jgi:hypothetical protein
MGLRVPGASSFPPLYDEIEGWDTPFGTIGGAQSNAPGVVRSFSTQQVSAARAQLFPSVTGALPAKALSATVGRQTATVPSAAGSTGAQSTAALGQSFPYYLRFDLPGSPPVRWLPPLCRYQVDFILRVVVQGTARMVAGAGGGSPVLVDNFQTAAVWSSLSTENGGAWTPAYRLVNGGVVLLGPPLPTPQADWHKLSLRFDEGTPSRLVWLSDDSPVFELTNPPFNMAGQNMPSIGYGVSGPAGSTSERMLGRFRVWEL